MFTFTNWDNAIERIALTAWVGAIWSVGFMVVPALFALVEDRDLAGDIAGHLFHFVSYLGFLCAAILLILAMIRGMRSRIDWKFTALIVTMLLITLVAEFVVVPQMVDIRIQAGGELVAGTPLYQRFSEIHRLASGLFVAVSILGLLAVLVAEPNLFTRAGRRKAGLP